MGVVYAGTAGSITFGAVAWELSEWSFEASANLLDITTFAAGGYRVKIPGLVAGRITARGPYETGSMALTVGAAVSVAMTVGGAITFTVPCIVGSISVSQAVEQFGQVSVSLESTGSFTAAIT
jgi:hypothetical protein